MNVEQSTLQFLRETVSTLVAECTDVDLLDLIGKLLVIPPS